MISPGELGATFPAAGLNKQRSNRQMSSASNDAFPVRLFGAACEGCAVTNPRTVEMLRPRSTIKKSFHS